MAWMSVESYARHPDPFKIAEAALALVAARQRFLDDPHSPTSSDLRIAYDHALMALEAACGLLEDNT